MSTTTKHDAPAEKDQSTSQEPEDQFKLAPVGSPRYVAGQPVDDAELKKVTEEHKKLMEAGEAAAKARAVPDPVPPPAAKNHQNQHR